MGFFLICGGNAVSLIVNVILGQNIVSSVVSAVLMPLIIWLLIKNTWYEFQ
jgi:large-conductance mechanosensitive channel